MPLDGFRLNEENRRDLQDKILSAANWNTNSLTPQGQTLQAFALVLDCLTFMREPQDMFGDVSRFHVKFEQGYSGGPRELPQDEQKFRITCLEEELSEYLKAVKERDLEGQFDALIDLIYFALGTAYRCGFPFPQGWARIQQKNMLKVLASEENPSRRGFMKHDVVKPAGWTPPDLSDLVNRPKGKQVVGSMQPPVVPTP